MNIVNVLHSKHAIKFILLLLLRTTNKLLLFCLGLLLLGQYIAKSRRLELAMFDKLFAEMSEYF